MTTSAGPESPRPRISAPSCCVASGPCVYRSGAQKTACIGGRIDRCNGSCSSCESQHGICARSARRTVTWTGMDAMDWMDSESEPLPLALRLPGSGAGAIGRGPLHARVARSARRTVTWTGMDAMDWVASESEPLPLALALAAFRGGCDRETRRPTPLEETGAGFPRTAVRPFAISPEYRADHALRDHPASTCVRSSPRAVAADDARRDLGRSGRVEGARGLPRDRSDDRARALAGSRPRALRSLGLDATRRRRRPAAACPALAVGSVARDLDRRGARPNRVAHRSGREIPDRRPAADQLEDHRPGLGGHLPALGDRIAQGRRALWGKRRDRPRGLRRPRRLDDRRDLLRRGVDRLQHRRCASLPEPVRGGRCDAHPRPRGAARRGDGGDLDRFDARVPTAHASRLRAARRRVRVDRRAPASGSISSPWRARGTC